MNYIPHAKLLYKIELCKKNVKSYQQFNRFLLKT